MSHKEMAHLNTSSEVGRTYLDNEYYLSNGKIITPVTRHIGLHYKFNNTSVSFFVLGVIPPNPRGGDWDNLILRFRC